MAGWNEDSGPNRLLPEVIGRDVLLYTCLDCRAKKLENGKIHSGVHQPKRITRRGNAIKVRKLFKPTLEDLYVRGISDCPSQLFGAFMFGRGNDESLYHIFGKQRSGAGASRR